MFWRHRVWPKENPQNKPSLQEMLPDSVIAQKVEGYLRKSDALEYYWQRPITSEQLQAELDRMARETKQPAILNELFAALDHDPYLIAECLARPNLADRFIHNLYAHDERFHGQLKHRVESELNVTNTTESMRALSGEYRETVWNKEESKRESQPALDSTDSVMLDSAEWNDWITRLQSLFGSTDDSLALNRLSGLQEDAERFYVMVIMEMDASHIKTAVVEWKKQSFEDWWSVAKTQTRPEVAAAPTVFHLPAAAPANSCDDTWTPTLAPPPSRIGHTAVWTGTEMIIWGGYANGYFNSGGRYNPSTDT